MLEFSKTKTLVCGFSLALLVGCGTTDTQPDARDQQEMVGETAEDERRDGEAFAADDERGVDDEDLTDEERAARQRAEQEALLDQTVVYFDFDSSDIRRESRDVLEAHASFMTANGATQVVLEGHTDERGSKEYNMALGERRAESVARFLTVNGVDSNQIETVSYGEERPAVDESNEEAWAKNRRVEIIYE